jgi:Rrf2 family protein
MDMTLSKRGDYVMRSAISLAQAFDDGTPRKIREIVADTAVPQTFASQILADLVRAGLAISKAGRDGGYRLSRRPAEISVLEVIEAGEGPLRAERCALGEGPCRWEAVCPLHETWIQATVVLRELLAGTTLAEIAARDHAIEAGTYEIPADSHRSHPVAVALADVVQVEVCASEMHRALVRVAPRLDRIVAGAVAEMSAADAAADPEVVPGRTRPSAQVAEASLAPLGSQVAGETPDLTRYLLTWRLTGTGPASRLEAELSVTPVDAERSEVRADGTWRQFPDGIALLGAAELERQARRTLRVVLRHLARFCEEPPGGQRRQPNSPSVTFR